MYWSKWESFYASSIQLLKFFTFTGIFENHLRFDVRPQPQQPQNRSRNSGHGLFVEIIPLEKAERDYIFFQGAGGSSPNDLSPPQAEKFGDFVGVERTPVCGCGSAAIAAAAAARGQVAGDFQKFQ